MFWVVLMLFMFTSSPSTNRFIGIEEKVYINEKTKHQIGQKKNMVTLK